MTSHLHRTIALAAVVMGALACSGDEPTTPAAESGRSHASLDRTSPSFSYTLSLACKKDAVDGSNVGLAVVDDAFGVLYTGVLACGEVISVGPGATRLFYNINIWNASGPVMSCQSDGYIPMEGGKFRCTEDKAHLILAEGKGNTATLTIKKD